MRGLLGLIVGIVAGLAAMMLAGFVGSLLFPAGGVADPRHAEGVVEGLRTASAGAQAALLVSWFAGALGGAAAAKAVSGLSWPGWTIAGLLALVLAFIFLLPLPVWMQALAPVAPLLGGLLAELLVSRRSADPAATAKAD